MIWRGVEVYAADRDAAIHDLGIALMRGELALFLGAGVSMDAQLPSWTSLVKRCCESPAVNVQATDLIGNVSTDVLTGRMDAVEAKCERTDRYLECVHNCLYDGFVPMAQPTALLRAIGAMIMGSRRGSIRDILTLNFDNVLEDYLNVHGVVADVVLSPRCLRSGNDVTVFHPNGYLPRNQRDKWSDRIVFSRESFGVALTGQNPWREQIRFFLETKVVVVVGMSFSDPIITSLVASVKAEGHTDGRPVAFWLTTEGVNDGALVSMKKCRVVPVRCATHDEYSEILLKICRCAAAELRAWVD